MTDNQTAPASTEEPLLEKLHEAREQLALANRRWENYDGNNPNKYQASIADARAEVHRLETLCKEQGLIELSEEEVLWARIDVAFPDAPSRQIVEFEGVCYQRRFSPVSTSRSGKTVKGWRASWVRLEEDSEAVKAFRAPPLSEEEISRNKALVAAWPFSEPAGGMTLRLEVGTPAIEAAVAQKTIDFQRGHAVKRSHLKATVWATEEAVSRILSAAAAQGDAPRRTGTRRSTKAHEKPSLWLGVNEAGESVYLRKKGAGHSGLFVGP